MWIITMRYIGSENLIEYGRKRMIFKNYFTAFISIIFIFFRYLTVFAPQSATAFDLYILSVVWFAIFAWIIIVVKIVKITSKSEINKHELISTLLIILCYVVTFVDGVSFNIV